MSLRVNMLAVAIVLGTSVPNFSVEQSAEGELIFQPRPPRLETYPVEASASVEKPLNFNQLGEKDPSR